MASIQYIPHDAIDFHKWDGCINQSPQGLVYAYSWYLNLMSPGWHALVWGDYEAVMPLTGRRKWGIHYLYQPAFCAELGIFSKGLLQAKDIALFLAHIPARYRYVDICLNSSNPAEDTGYACRMRNNYILSLRISAEELQQKYSENHIRNIKKAVRQQLVFDASVDIQAAVQLARSTVQNKASYKADEWNRFEALFRTAMAKGAACCTGVRDTTGRLLSAAVFFQAHHTWFYILAGSSREGKKMGASHFLLDRFIHVHAGKDMQLDFEGSDVESVAHFYRGFGAVNRPYPALVINRLPGWLRWLKR